MPPYAVGPPGIGFGSGLTASASASAKKKAPEPDDAAAAAKSQAATRRQARARQRKRTTQRRYGDEYMEMDVEVDPDYDALPEVSNQGAGPLGLPGTAHKDAVTEAAGLTRLTDDQFGSGPTMPMVPSTWR
jgi:PPE-repeat protein